MTKIDFQSWDPAQDTPTVPSKYVVEVTESLVECLIRGMNCWTKQEDKEGKEILKIIQKYKEQGR